MNKKVFCLSLIGCFVITSILACCGCTTKKDRKISIKYESRYSSAKQKVKSKVIDLSDNKNVNFDYKIGPQDPSGPSFNMVTVGGH